MADDSIEGHAMSYEGTSHSLPRAKVLTPTEASRILAAAKEKDARDYVFLSVAFNVGLRLCEIVHIRKSDLIDGQLQVTRRKKRHLKPEMIDVGDQLWSLLSEWGQMFEGSDWIFPGEAEPCIIQHTKREPEQVCEGGHISKRNLQRRWELYLVGLGIKLPGRGIHTTRHYAITAFYNKHRDIVAAKDFAGHSSVAITQTYAHTVEMREKVKAMEELI